MVNIHNENKIISTIRKSPNQEILKEDLKKISTLSPVDFYTAFQNLQKNGRIAVATIVSGEEKVKEAKRVTG